MGSRFTELIIDCIQPERVAAFWAAALDWRVTDSEDGVVEIAGPEGSSPRLVFVPVLEQKALKNRVHVDVNPVGCDQVEEVERLLGLGARRVDVGQGEQSWVVLADPEGNEFCVLGTRLA
jgi:hypothetical protein